MSNFVKYFSEVKQGDMLQVGGKGANLVELSTSGFSVPPGFCITTHAYRAFLRSSDLEERIASTIADVDLSVFENVRTCGAAIRALIMEQWIPDEIKKAILPAYWKLFTLTPALSLKSRKTNSPRLAGEGPGVRSNSPLLLGEGLGVMRSKLYVAVRSSATAEDLSDASFAGQHDSYLNIFGNSDLLFSIKQCWASLWSDRAIAYRHKQGIEQTAALMAVVIQRMVPSTVSGVLFTANPLTSTHNELLINANWGLGESLVSGKVTPDEYVLDKAGSKVIRTAIAEKTTMVTLGDARTRKAPVPSEQQARACLSDEQIRQLAFIGKELEEHFQVPQDVEWGIVDDQLFILQSRPITTLQAEPKTPRVIWGNPKTQELFEDTVVFWSNLNVRETMPYPHVPLSWSFWKEIILPEVAKAVMDIDIAGDTPIAPYQSALDLVDGRIYFNMNLLYGHPTAGPLIRNLFPHIDKEVGTALKTLYEKGEMPPVPYPQSQKGTWFIIKTVTKITARLFSTLWRFHPDRLEKTIRQYWQDATEFETMEFRGRSQQELLNAVKTFNREMLQLLAPWNWAIVALIISYQVLEWLTRSYQEVSVDRLLAGIPGNKTTEAALELYKLSQMPEALKEIFLSHEIEEIPASLKEREAGKTLLKWIGQFLDRYGHRSAKEFDLGEPRWKEDPTFVFQMIKNYLQLNDTDTTPLEHFQHKAEEREELTKHVNDRLSQNWLARIFSLKRWLFNKVLSHVHTCMPLRENFKYYMLKSLCGSRRIFLELGRRLDSEGYLESPDDIYFLMLPELEEIARGKSPVQDTLIKKLVQQRKQEWEANLACDPPVIVRSDGEPVLLSEQEPQADHALTGTPVSGGKVRGKARIIRDPAEGAVFNKGEILVAPVTDPGWTPLFLTAKALVMEVGGIMCHGAVVAREYGIPAVVGVKGAINKIRTGDEIVVDGTLGRVLLL